jgi:hypothetical protein
MTCEITAVDNSQTDYNRAHEMTAIDGTQNDYNVVML